MMQFTSKRVLNGSEHPWLASLATTMLLLAFCSCSDPSAENDLVETRDAAADSTSTDDGSTNADAVSEHAADAPVSDTAAETADDAAPLSCSLTPSGTCSPAPTPGQDHCNGCYEVKGQVFDRQRKCLKGVAPTTVACTTLCTGGAALECYTRGDQADAQVILSTLMYSDPTQFQADTGFTPCASDLRSEVLAAPQCSAE